MGKCRPVLINYHYCSIHAHHFSSCPCLWLLPGLLLRFWARNWDFRVETWAIQLMCKGLAQSIPLLTKRTLLIEEEPVINYKCGRRTLIFFCFRTATHPLLSFRSTPYFKLGTLHPSRFTAIAPLAKAKNFSRFVSPHSTFRRPEMSQQSPFGADFSQLPLCVALHRQGNKPELSSCGGGREKTKPQMDFVSFPSSWLCCSPANITGSLSKEKHGAAAKMVHVQTCFAKQQLPSSQRADPGEIALREAYLIIFR